MVTYTVITGLSGSGKTTYLTNLKVKYLSYDNVYDYSQQKISYDRTDLFLNQHKNADVYMDAYNEDLINYIKKRDSAAVFKCVFIYSDLDAYYQTLAIELGRNFAETDRSDITYDEYIKFIVNSMTILNNITKRIFSDITYKYRKDDKYVDYKNDQHLMQIINMSKNERLLKYIDVVSGHSTYQSIMIGDEYIKRGTEKDWLSFENILKCTSLKNKTVYDAGCFNGYFSFRALKEGAKQVIGVDHNKPAIDICNKLCIYNGFHRWNLGKMKDFSSGISFHIRKLGQDKNIFDMVTEKIDVVFALNFLHHLKNELGSDAFISTVDTFFKHSNEVIFEVNEAEISDIQNIAGNNNFVLNKKIESHRKTMFGNRWVLHYIKSK